MRITDDDDVAISRNREELKKELQRERPKKEIILSLSRQTFCARRAEVLSEASDVCFLLTFRVSRISETLCGDYC